MFSDDLHNVPLLKFWKLYLPKTLKYRLIKQTILGEDPESKSVRYSSAFHENDGELTLNKHCCGWSWIYDYILGEG